MAESNSSNQGEALAEIQRPPPKYYKYEEMVPDVVDDVPPGAVLPLEELPEDNRCPWCGDGPYRNSNGLRGHAHGKHGIRWDTAKERDSRIRTAAQENRLQEAHERTELKLWHKTNIALKELYGLTWEEIRERTGKGHPAYMTRLANSPAGLEFIESIHATFESPEKIAELLLRANAVNATADYLVALEWAKEARDYDAVYKMSKDLIKLSDIKKPEDAGGGATVHIHLDSKSLEMPEVPTSYEVLESEVVDET